MTPPPATSQSPATPKATGDITLAPMAHAPTAVATVATVSRTEPPSLILRKYRRLGPAGGLIDTKHSCPDLLSSAGGHPRDVRVTPATRGHGATRADGTGGGPSGRRPRERPQTIEFAPEARVG
jgi:hypothetical protein